MSLSVVLIDSHFCSFHWEWDFKDSFYWLHLDDVNRIGFYIFWVAFSLIWNGCQPKGQYTTKPAKSLTNPDSDLLEVNAIAYHLNDSVTRFFVEVKNENLVYKRPDTTAAFYAELRVTCKLLAETNSKKIIDSCSFYMYDRSVSESIYPKSLLSQFKLMARRGNNYFLDITVLDIGKRTQYHAGLNIYKQTNFSDQNFLVTKNDSVVFKNNFLENEKVVVQFQNRAVRQVTVDCFFKEFGPAAPPFSTKSQDELKYKPDSIFEMQLSTNQFMLTMPAKGFFHVRTSTESLEGISLYTYDKTFPGVSNAEEMINCTRYIMSREEFDNCKQAADKKNCIDNFWLTVGGSNERARELLKRYYGRVKEANKNYSNYTQGWKSDRGMVYIVFGDPTNVYRSKSDEIWVYGNEANPNMLRFIFNKTQNPFTDNDFVMERSVFYKDAWYNTVDAWRQGVLYLDTPR